MSYRFKRREMRGGGFFSFYLDVYDAQGALRFSLSLPDHPLSGGASVTSYFRISPDGRFLVVDSVQRFLGERDFSLSVYAVETGGLLYESDYEDDIRFSEDGRLAYVRRDQFYFNHATVVLDTATAGVIEERDDCGALFETGLPASALKVEEEIVD